MRILSVIVLSVGIGIFLGSCSDETGGNGTGDGGDQKDGQDQLDGSGMGDADGSQDDGTSEDGGGEDAGSSDGGDQSGADVEDLCRSVDLVIVVDGSGSMGEELRAMRETVFPALAQRLSELGRGLDDFRVATADACPDPANFHTRGDGGECNFHGGNVWIESTSPTLNQEFECVGDIYLDDINCSGSNDDEQPASAAATALELPWIDGANAGFLRDDAMLVIMAITDEDETPTGSADTAQEIFDRLVAIKGRVSDVIFLGVGGSRDCDGEYGSADHAELLIEITDLFIENQRGVFWDLCEGRLEDGLEQAIEVIESACYQ